MKQDGRRYKFNITVIVKTLHDRDPDQESEIHANTEYFYSVFRLKSIMDLLYQAVVVKNPVYSSISLLWLID